LKTSVKTIYLEVVALYKEEAKVLEEEEGIDYSVPELSKGEGKGSIEL
jgi:hypothetical protein